MILETVVSRKLSVAPLPGDRWRIGSAETAWYDGDTLDEAFLAWSAQYDQELLSARARLLQQISEIPLSALQANRELWSRHGYTADVNPNGVITLIPVAGTTQGVPE